MWSEARVARIRHERYTKPMDFYVYILECADGTLYAGSTSDLERRLLQHNHLKSGARYTKARRPVTLVYCEVCPSLSVSRSREWEVKQFTREEKMVLVESLHLR